jgi:hypothetical protein
VEHAVDAVERIRDRSPGAHVCHDELRLPAQVLHPTGGEIVQDAHLMPSVEQALDKMGADETSSTGY